MTNFIQGKNDWWQEGDLRILFPNCRVRLLDDEIPDVPSCDFGVDTSYAPYLLIELKDPNSAGSTPTEKRDFTARMATPEFINHDLVDAAINSKIHMQNQEPDHQDYQFIILLGIQALFNFRTVNQLLTFVSERVRQRLFAKGETAMGETVDVVDEASFVEHFPFPLMRISATEAA